MSRTSISLRLTFCVGLIMVGLIVVVSVFGLCSNTELTGTIRMYPGTYCPVEPTPTNPRPPRYLLELKKQYEQLHPRVKIEFVPPVATGTNYDIWLQTQILGKTVPEVIWQDRLVTWQHYQKGWYIPLDEYLDMPNPYVKGNKRWGDIFFKDFIDGRRAPDGKLYSLNLDLVVTGIYYNKNIFQRIGASPPDTWDELMTIAAKIKQLGVYPFAVRFTGDDHSGWYWPFGTIQDMMLDSKMEEIAGRPVTKSIGGAPVITTKELVRAIKQGKYSARDPQYQEIWRIFKDWSQYWAPGFLGMTPEVRYRLFVTGRGAMIWDTCALIRTLKEDPLRKFEFGIFQPPTITKATSKYATGAKAPVRGGSGAAAQYAIPVLNKERGLLEEAIDWLMYISAPQNVGPLVEDLGMFVPNVIGAHVKTYPELQDLAKPLLARAIGTRISHHRALDAQYDEALYKIAQEYIGGRITLEEAMNRVQKEMDAAAVRLIEQNNWKDLM